MGYNDIENGMLRYHGGSYNDWNIYDDDYDYEEEKVTFFVPYIMVNGELIEGDEYDDLKEARVGLDKMEEENETYEDAYIIEYDENYKEVSFHY